MSLGACLARTPLHGPAVPAGAPRRAARGHPSSPAAAVGVARLARTCPRHSRLRLRPSVPAALRIGERPATGATQMRIPIDGIGGLGAVTARCRQLADEDVLVEIVFPPFDSSRSATPSSTMASPQGVSNGILLQLLDLYACLPCLHLEIWLIWELISSSHLFE
jgi:hypothetical protein